MPWDYKLAPGIEEIGVITWGDSVTAFGFNGGGYAVDEFPIGSAGGGAIPWFGTMTFYDVPIGYIGEILDMELGGFGDGRRGFTATGVGGETLLERLAAYSVTVHKRDYALGGSRADEWSSDVPEFGEVSEAAYLRPPSSNWLGYRHPVTNLTVGEQIREWVDADIPVIIVGTMGGNDLFIRVNHSGGQLLDLDDEDGYWHGTFKPTFYSQMREIIGYFVRCARGDIDAGIPPQAEIVLGTYPNFNIGGNETITHYFPKTDIDGSVVGARKALWSTDQLGYYREFYRNVFEAKLSDHVTKHNNYRVGDATWLAANGYDVGPIPLEDQLDNTNSGAWYLMADQRYRNWAYTVGVGFHAAHARGSLVDREDVHYTITPLLGTNGAYNFVQPPNFLTNSTWTYTTMNGWNIAARNIHENTINRHMQEMIGGVAAQLDAELQAAFGNDHCFQYLPLWDFFPDETRTDVDDEYKPMPVEYWFDLIHPNTEGSRLWTGAFWDGMADRSNIFLKDVLEIPVALQDAGPEIAEWKWYLDDRSLVAEAAPPFSREREMTMAMNRRVTFDIDDPHTATFDITGFHPESFDINETIDDLVCVRNDVELFRGRIGSSTDSLDTNVHNVTFNAVAYKGLLDRRILHTEFDTTASPEEQSDIVWDFITHTQLQEGGDLGITRGIDPNTGVLRGDIWEEGEFIGQIIEEMGARESGFDWDISTTGEFDVYFPNRGSISAGLLDFGGSVIRVERDLDVSEFANSIWATGQNAGVDTVVLSRVDNIGTNRPEGLWELTAGTEDAKSTAEITRVANGILAKAIGLVPSYTLTLRQGSWEGPDHFWIGDTIQVIIRNGRLAVNEVYRIFSMEFNIGSSGEEEINVTVGHPETSIERRLWKYGRRINNLETR